MKIQRDIKPQPKMAGLAGPSPTLKAVKELQWQRKSKDLVLLVNSCA